MSYLKPTTGKPETDLYLNEMESYDPDVHYTRLRQRHKIPAKLN
ncbi:hypothetical protein [Gimesia sp.]